MDKDMKKHRIYDELTESFPDGTRGKDPRVFTPEDLRELGFVKKSIMKVIRDKCADCCGSDLSKPRNVQKEIAACTAIRCPLWLYRMGSNPMVKREMSEEQRQEARERLARARGVK